MAVLHLQFEIDSEVHPELHDMLSSIGGARSREERLRQLASTGLVWERLRLQAYGIVPLAVPEPTPPNRVEGADVGVDAGADASADASVPAAVDREETPVDLADCVDLADHPEPAADALASSAAGIADAATGDIDAMPVPRPSDPDAPEIAPEVFVREMRSAVKELPVLTEVVEVVDFFSSNPAAAAAAKESATRGRPKFGTRTPARPSGRDLDFHDAATEASRTDPTHDSPPVRKPAARSRLMRMNERGLFKNE